MAKINTYTSDSDIAGTERIIGSDTDGTTLNYSIQDIGVYYATNYFALGGHATFKFTTSTVANMSSGEIGGGTASNTNWTEI